MKPALLDASVLIALLWPAHEHHEAAHHWFGAGRSRRWATCPLTQLAFVRIVSNPAFSPEAPAPAEALVLLQRNLARPAHVFWPDDLELGAALGRASARLQGHRQLTDAYLLALAAQRKGVLATFDAGLRTVAAGGLAGALELVPRA